MASWKRFFHRSAPGSRALGLGGTLALFGVGMVALGGCTLDRAGLVAGTGGTSSSSTTSASSAGTTVSTGGCTTGAGCTPCVEDVDCGAPTNDGCTASTCVASVCTPKGTAGDPAATQTANDCKKNVCGADGKPASEDDPLDLPADEGNACTDQTCVGGTPTFSPVALGTACASGTCDDKGICVNCTKDGDCQTGTTPTCDQTLNTCISCSDTIKNGTETTPDCGGNCKICDGDACSKGMDCKSGQCFDGVCCNAACAGLCQACNLPGSIGVCTSVPAGQPDATDCDSPMDACNGAGACKKAAGAMCAQGSECGSGFCFAGLCRTEDGGDCTTGLTCASGSCLNLKCADCGGAGDCASAVCTAMTCKAPLGAACEGDSDCGAGTCQFNLCLVANNGACTLNADCVSGVCKAGMCAPCSVADPCTVGASCGATFFGPAGTCNRPKGAYCYVKNQCEGLKPCTGFPPTCQ